MKNKNIWIVVIASLFIVILMGCLYFLSQNNKMKTKIHELESVQKENVEEKLEKIKKIVEVDDIDSAHTFFESEYLQTLPVHYDENGKIASYTVDELTKEEKQYFIWKCLLYHNYIYYGNAPEHFLQTYLGKNFELSEFTLWDNFVLKKEKDEYVATTLTPTEMDNENIYRITDFDIQNDKLILYFDSFSHGYGFYKAYSGIATFEKNNYEYYLEKVQIIEI